MIKTRQIFESLNERARSQGEKKTRQYPNKEKSKNRDSVIPGLKMKETEQWQQLSNGN